MKKGKVVHKLISIVLVNAMVFVGFGCAGSAPNPVERYMPGDEKRGCPALFAEMGDIDNEVATRQTKIGDRDFWNVILFIGGLVVIVPFFFMNVKNSEETEIAAYKSRRSNLKIIAAEKECVMVPAETTNDQEN